MVVYSHFSKDARVRRYAESLARKNIVVDIICLKENYTPKNSKISLIQFPINRRRLHPLWYIVEYISFFLFSIFMLSKRSLHKKYQIIHVHNMPDFLVFCGLVPKLAGAKIILDMHDPMPELYLSKFNKRPNHILYKLLVFIEGASCRFAHVVLTANDTFKALFIKRHKNLSRKIHTILNCPDPRIFKFKPKTAKIGNRFTLLYMGTVEERFGLDIAIKSIALLSHKLKAIRLIIIPKLDYEGSYLTMLKKMVGDLGLAQHVEFLPPKPLEEIVPVVQNADIGIVLARKNIFTQRIFPVKLLEFVQLGIPVIATQTRQLENYFDSTSIKFLKKTSTSHFSKAVTSLYKNKALMKELPKNAARYLITHNWFKEEKKYQMIIGSFISD